MRLLVTFGQKLKALRVAKNISSEQLAEEVDVTKSLIWSYEINKKEPSSTHLIKIADYFEVTVDYLLDREKKKFDINLQNSIEDIIDNFIISIDDIQLSKDELLESIAYIQAKRIMRSQTC
jgi:transcriptional regulator with XRE-family HTH domain